MLGGRLGGLLGGDGGDPGTEGGIDGGLPVILRYGGDGGLRGELVTIDGVDGGKDGGDFVIEGIDGLEGALSGESADLIASLT